MPSDPGEGDVAVVADDSAEVAVGSVDDSAEVVVTAGSVVDLDDEDVVAVGLSVYPTQPESKLLATTTMQHQKNIPSVPFILGTLLTGRVGNQCKTL